MSDNSYFEIVNNLVSRLVNEARHVEELKGNAALREREIAHAKEIESLNRTIADLKNTERDLRNRIEDFHTSTTELEYRIDELESQLDQARLASTQKDVEITDLEHRIVELETELDSLTFENHDLKVRIDRDNGIFDTYKKSTEDALTNLRNELAESVSQITELEHRIFSEREVNASWVSSSTLKDTIIADLRASVDNYMLRVNEDAATITDLRAKVGALESELNNLQDEYDIYREHMEDRLSSAKTVVATPSPEETSDPFPLHIFPLRDVGLKLGHRYKTREGNIVEIYDLYDGPSNYHFRGRYTNLTSNIKTFWTKEGSYYSPASRDFKPTGDSDDLIEDLGPSHSTYPDPE